MGSRVRLRGRKAVRGQHARRRIREHIGESRARYGDEVVAVGAAALAEEQQSLGVAGTAERHVVDEALSRLMPQIHRPLFRRRGNVLLIDSGSSALNPCNAVTRGSDRPFGDIAKPRRQFPPHHWPPQPSPTLRPKPIVPQEHRYLAAATGRPAESTKQIGRQAY